METRKVLGIWIGTLLVFMAACTNPQSLQHYYLENETNPDFIFFDIPIGILNIDQKQLSEEQRKAVRSMRKLKILAFEKKATNEAILHLEKRKINTILSNPSYKELIKLNTPYGKGVVKFLGTDDTVDELVVFCSKDTTGFALIRVLGDNLNPVYLTSLIKAIQESEYNSVGLNQFGWIFD